MITTADRLGTLHLCCQELSMLTITVNIIASTIFVSCTTSSWSSAVPGGPCRMTAQACAVADTHEGGSGCC
jgi:hypothetical protein